QKSTGWNLLSLCSLLTFGSGIVQPFKGESYYVRSDCPFKLTSFNVNRGEYSVTIWRGHNGLLVQVEIIVNKVTTLLQNGHILVQNNRFEPKQKTAASLNNK
uniref:Uncharacterized protein n=1 Tax=Gasterosteus aculeatus aculeatus TaxID=481459 RepID=A0AAQ4RX88_GASAC